MSRKATSAALALVVGFCALALPAAGQTLINI